MNGCLLHLPYYLMIVHTLEDVLLAGACDGKSFSRASNWQTSEGAGFRRCRNIRDNDTVLRMY
jgi:hypothetical protein